jgi:hypothetical protein
MVGAIASERVPVGNATGALWGSWLNPTAILIGVLAVATGAYMAAVSDDGYRILTDPYSPNGLPRLDGRPDREAPPSRRATR